MQTEEENPYAARPYLEPPAYTDWLTNLVRTVDGNAALALGMFIGWVGLGLFLIIGVVIIASVREALYWSY